MDRSAYEIEARTEQTHWWFVGRRHLFSEIIAGLSGLQTADRILDVGTSTGTNLRMLRDLGYQDVRGLDMSPVAAGFCADKGFGQVDIGDVCDLPYPDNHFQLVLATDIVEHVDDDEKALQEIRRVTAPNGHVLLTVPAFQSLWGSQDVIAHHKRRYRREQFVDRVRARNLEVEKSFYFNFILFPPIYLVRRLVRLFSLPVENENHLTPSVLNVLLTRLFKLDVWMSQRLSVPFGVSIAVIARPSEVAVESHGKAGRTAATI